MVFKMNFWSFIMKRVLFTIFLLIIISCIYVKADKLIIWGDNASGQLGDGTVQNKTSPIQVGTVTDWILIQSGGTFSFAIKNDGSIWTWGSNNFGELGDGTTTQRNSPVQIGNGMILSKVACGLRHTVVIKNDGTLWAWGANYSGQLGDGTTTQRNSPIQIGNSSNWTNVACGLNHTLAIKNDGTLWAWGGNGNGQLGDGTTTNRKSPVQIGIGNNWSKVVGGYSHTLAIKSDSTLWAWGANNGQLGDGTTTQRNSPIQIGTNSNWSKVFGGDNHTIAIKRDGTLWVWGNNAYGQLGNGTTNNELSPVQADSNTKWLQVTCGRYYTLAINCDSTLFAWGFNSYGQLGDGTKTKRLSPVQIGTEIKWSKVSCGIGHSIAFTHSSIMPAVTTSDINNITRFSALGGGNITNDGGADVTTRGVCWNTTSGVTIANSKTTENGNFSLGSFSANFTDLIPNSLYYAKAYGTNNVGTGYGDEKTFVTLPDKPSNLEVTDLTSNSFKFYWSAPIQVGNQTYTYDLQISSNIDFSSPIIDQIGLTSSTLFKNTNNLIPDNIYYLRVRVTNAVGSSSWSDSQTTTLTTFPTLTTSALTSITSITALSGGNVTSDGGVNVSARGVCWSLSHNPTIANDKTSDGTGIGNFTSNITGLIPNTSYYVRAYATNTVGTGYGGELNFTTLLIADNFKQLSFQGVIKNSQGILVADGTYNFTFKLYSVSNSATPIWSETKSILIENGIFNTELGSVTPLDVSFQTSYWLGIKFEDEEEMTPRTKLVGPIYQGGGFGR
jgi:alpha-tubulin suppressor-like RCC1 family protein